MGQQTQFLLKWTGFAALTSWWDMKRHTDLRWWAKKRTMKWFIPIGLEVTQANPPTSHTGTSAGHLSQRVYSELHTLRRHLDTKEITHGIFLLFHHTSEFREIDSNQADDEFWRVFLFSEGFFFFFLMCGCSSIVPSWVHIYSFCCCTFVRLKVIFDPCKSDCRFSATFQFVFLSGFTLPSCVCVCVCGVGAVDVIKTHH